MKRNPFERDLPPGAAPQEPLSLLEPLPPVVTTHTAPPPAPGAPPVPQPAASHPLPSLETSHTPPQALDPIAVQHSGAQLLTPLERTPVTEPAPLLMPPASMAAEAPNLEPVALSHGKQYDPLPTYEAALNVNPEALEPIEPKVGMPEPLQAIGNNHTAPEPVPPVQFAESAAPEGLPRVEVNHQAPELLAPVAAAPPSTPDPLQASTGQYTSSATPLPALKPALADPLPTLPPLETTQSKQDEVDVEALLSSVQPREERSFFRLSGVPLLSEM